MEIQIRNIYIYISASIETSFSMILSRFKIRDQLYEISFNYPNLSHGLHKDNIFSKILIQYLLLRTLE